MACCVQYWVRQITYESDFVTCTSHGIRQLNLKLRPRGHATSHRIHISLNNKLGCLILPHKYKNSYTKNVEKYSPNGMTLYMPLGTHVTLN